jgi:RNA polymerase sigma factor (sigma-70 family)
MTDEISSSVQMVSIRDRNPQGVADAMCAALQRGAYEQALDLFGRLEDLTKPLLIRIALEEGPAEEIDELVADTYIGLFRHVESGKPIGNVKALLRTILKRRIVDAFRRRDGVTLVSADALSGGGAAALPDALEIHPQADVDDAETVTQIKNTILDALPSLEREVLMARYLHELTVPQTAARLGLTADQVKKYTQRALQQARHIGVEKGLHHDLP